MTAIAMPLAVAILVGFAAMIPFSERLGRTGTVWIAAGAMALALATLGLLIPDVLNGQIHIFRAQWLPDSGLNLSFRLDGLGLLFSLLILGIGLLVILYAAYYLPERDKLIRFYGLLLAFAGSMLGVVLAENLLLLLVFWELTSLASFLLIAYNHGSHDARIGARMALAVTGGGGLALLAGLLLLGHMAGSFELSDVLSRGDQIRTHAFYPVALVLILLGAFTKSAQFPFHFWLPNAMSAPTPVSAYLHSATMVKAGVFLLARLYPVLSGSDLWFMLVSGTGALTLVYGAYTALLKHDFKGLLAYSTISHLGLITLLFGLDTPLSAVAAIFHIINHAIFKASLFMAAGIIDHECGTRDMRRINGLFSYMPWTATLGIVAAGAMAGVPLMNGFLSKEMFFAETVGHPAFQGFWAYALPAFATLAATLTVAYSARFVHDVFFNGEPINLPKTPHEPPRWMRLPVEVLVALCLGVGLLPQFFVGPILAAAAGAVLPGSLPLYELAIWHGFNFPLMMSGGALAAGLLYYWRRHHLFQLHRKYAFELTSPVAFERAYSLVVHLSAALVGLADNRSLQRYLTLMIVTPFVLATYVYWTGAGISLRGELRQSLPDPVALAGFFALLAGSLGTVLSRSRLAAVVYLSIVGLVVSLSFIRFSAPDLALTQLSVEILTIVLLLLSLRFLPESASVRESGFRRLRDAAIALVGGGGIAALCYAMLTRPFETISNFYLQNAVPDGGGRNAVNVILVDFRGFDTLGEIAVLAIAALGIHALAGNLRLSPHVPDATSGTDRYPIMLAMLMRPLLPLTLLVSVYILLRGHNLPGGGFIAGLVAGVAFMLQFIATGAETARARLPLDFVRLLGFGLILVAGTGLASWFFGYPFLTSTFAYLDPPLIGKLEVASAMIFDAGVYLVVIASVLLILTELGQLSAREIRHRAGKER